MDLFKLKGDTFIFAEKSFMIIFVRREVKPFSVIKKILLPLNQLETEQHRFELL